MHCDHEETKLVSYSEIEHQNCEKCGKKTTRVYTAPGTKTSDGVKT